MQVLSANRLSDGRVVYLTGGNKWQESINTAWLAEDEDTIGVMTELGQTGVQNALLVDPYFIDVAFVGDDVRPTRYREYLRAAGPSQDTARQI